MGKPGYEAIKMMKRHCALLAASLMILGMAVSCADQAPLYNQAPRFSTVPASLQVEAGADLSLTVSAEDPEGSTVRLSMIKGPAGAEFIAPSGLGRFYWAPTSADVGTHEVILEARDVQGVQATVSLQLQVLAPGGAPRFTIGPQALLDLSQESTLDLEVSVVDGDSASVDIFLESGPRGMQLTPTGAKTAQLTWTPDEFQIQSQPVWTASLLALDGDNPATRHELTIGLLGKPGDCQGRPGECSCQAPSIAHFELPAQNTLEDYRIQAWITDEESEVVAPTLHWTLGDPDDTASYQILPMDRAGEQYTALVPNPLLEPGEASAVYYRICAGDNDDAAGDTCDNYTCAPEVGAFRFRIFAPGEDLPEPDPCDACTPGQECINEVCIDPEPEPDPCDACTGAQRCINDVCVNPDPCDACTPEQSCINDVCVDPDPCDACTPGQACIEEVCVDPDPCDLCLPGQTCINDVCTDPEPEPEPECTDAFEPNQNRSMATPTSPGQLDDLWVCDGDLDLFRLPVQPGDTLSLEALFSHAEGDLVLALFGPDGQQVSVSDSSTDNEVLRFANFPVAGDYFIGVYGEPGVTASYSLRVEQTSIWRCQDDQYEPNDNPVQAPSLGFGEFMADACAGNDDYYRLQLSAGQNVRIELRSPQEDSDLDLLVISPNADFIIVSSESAGSTEILEGPSPFTGNFLIKVYAYQGAEGSYSLSITER